MKLINLWTTRFLEREKIAFSFQESAESSNDLAKTQAFQTSKNPYLFLVDHQRKGRGSNNRKWENSDLMLSFLWHKTEACLKVQACEGFAQDVLKALKKTWSDLEIRFKAPNDLFLKDKKLAGLLLEALSQGSRQAFILGLGLNVFSTPLELPASCLKDQVKDISQESWFVFLSTLIASWSNRYKNL